GSCQHGVVKEIDQLLDFGGSLLPFDADVDIFRVLTEDDHVELLGMLHRRGDALVVAHGADARVKIKDLAQGYVQGADSTADRRSQRPLDGDVEVANGVDRLLRKPVAETGEGLLPGENFKPVNLPFA